MRGGPIKPPLMEAAQMENLRRCVQNHEREGPLALARKAVHGHEKVTRKTLVATHEITPRCYQGDIGIGGVGYPYEGDLVA